MADDHLFYSRRREVQAVVKKGRRFYLYLRNNSYTLVADKETVELMAKSKLPHPTEGELAILRVLWRRGPSTVREVHTALSTEQAHYFGRR